MNDDVIDVIDHQQQQQQQQQQPQARKTTRLRLINFLERYDEFPFRTRNNMDELAEEYLSKAEDDVYDMLCDNRYGTRLRPYRGLDSSRDTEDEVEAIVRFFPEIVNKRTVGVDGGMTWDEGADKYPIQFMTSMRPSYPYRCNLKAVSFVLLVARLAIEFGSFQDHAKGGLLFKDDRGYNTLQCLSQNSSLDYGEEHNQFVDNEYLTQLIRLRHVGLFISEDIEVYELFKFMFPKNCFAERRFRFIVEWVPTILLRTYGHYQWLPLHCAACTSIIQGFRSVFEIGIRYYPIKKGISLLFTKDYEGDTPYQLACTEFARDEVIKVVEETLRVADDDNNNNNNNNTSVGPYNIIDAFIMTAIDEQIHFDCVYFLLRRKPDVLKRLLSGSISYNIDIGNGNGGGGGGNNENDVDNQMMAIDVNSNTDSNANLIPNVNANTEENTDANSNANTNTNNRKRKREF